ncbi:MAG: universal stress protein [Methanomicrobiales archaeon]|nr:universal stress protein [Methanomicrobiales archaeon]
MMSGLRKVLVPLDMWEGTGKILSAVEEIARVGVDEIELLHVVNLRDASVNPQISAYDEEVLSTWKKHLRSCGVPVVTTTVIHGIPWIEIIERSEREDLSLIVLGSHGRSIVSRMLLGSTTENVIHHAEATVLILRMKILEEAGAMTCRLATDRIFGRILYVTDFSENAERCLPYLTWMAPARPAEVLVVHVQDLRHLSYATPKQMDELNRSNTQRLDELKKKLRGMGFEKVSTVIRTGNAITEIHNVAHDSGASLIVMGAKGKYGVPEMILGGTTEAVVHQSGLHVLVVR